MILKQKNIAVFVTASIAIYKTLELIRLYIKAGASVKVVMTPSSKRFITALTFETISKNIVLCHESENWSEANPNNHISVASWCDIAVIAPASVNTINSLANGLAHNIALQTLIAYDGAKLLAPSANTNMLNNPITKANLKMLRACGYEVVQSVSKELACGDVGYGAMADIGDIYHKTVRMLCSNEYFTNRKVVLSGGGTAQKIDDVRFISNFSSGKMANAMATALYYMGADVCLVHTATAQKLDIAEIHTIEVADTKQMNEYITQCIKVAKRGVVTKATFTNDAKNIQKTPYFFSLAAVCDYKPRYPQSGKIKKRDIGANWSLELEKNIDILAELDKDGIYAIGFKAEFDDTQAVSNATNMLKEKNLSAVCLNMIGQHSFGGDDNNMAIFFAHSDIKLKTNDKLTLALDILHNLQREFSE